MSTDASFPDDRPQFAEFFADYLVESDEHLSIARRSLLTLETSLLEGKFDRAVVQELFRSFHSIKGLSAMVDFAEAEQLAHHLETFLGEVRRNQLSLDSSKLEGLIEGVAALEKLIAARRDNTKLPDISNLLNRIAILLPVAATDDEPPGAKKPVPQPVLLDEKDKDVLIAEKTATGAFAWQFTFTPSPALISRGIDVNCVRNKLQTLGEIVHSAPIIVAGGRIEFFFIVVSTEPAEIVLASQGDGLHCAKYVIPAPPAVEPWVESTGDSNDEHSTHLTPGNVVRVDLKRLDELMRLVGELVLSRSRLEENIRRLDGKAPPTEIRGLRESTSVIERQLRDLREAVMRVRMVPVREVFARMQFVVRDLIRDEQKQIAVRFSGEETQIDKFVVERIMDPLLHLVRNAVSHGLESSSDRLAAGKPVEGQLYLRARTTGETVIIEVEDDGRGIDAGKVISKATEQGLETSRASHDSASLLEILCVPGFSTRKQSDRVSGRGIGMDVVRTSVEELGGSLSLQTTLGQGTRFEIQLPLTLAITDALIVKVAAERFAVPQIAVREILRIESGSSTFIENNELLNYRTGALPLLRLSQHFGSTSLTNEGHYVLVTGEGKQGIGIVVDRVLGLREIVVRPLTDRLVQVPGISGATELGDGRVVLILDTANLSRVVRRRNSTPQPTRPNEPTTLLTEQNYAN
jgi:two-component system chemotaxis sensor kinase CheA